MASGSASPEDLDNMEYHKESQEHGSIKNSAINADPEFIIRFIHRVKQFPLLYNQDHEHFRNTNLKQQAWKQIAEEFGQTERWCIRKWVSLRDYFVKRKKRLRLGKPLRPWIYYNELSFLNVIYGHDQLDYYPNELAEGQDEEGNSYIYYAEDDDQAYGEESYDQGQYEVMDMDSSHLEDESEEYEYVQPVVEYGDEEPEKTPPPRVVQMHSSPITTASALYLQQQQRRNPPVLPRNSNSNSGGNKAGSMKASSNQGQSEARGPPPLSSFNSLNHGSSNSSSNSSLLRDHLSQSQANSQQASASKPPPLKREGGLPLPPLRRAFAASPSILTPQVKRTNGTSANNATSNANSSTRFLQQQQNNSNSAAKRPKLQAENIRTANVKQEVSFEWVDADSAGSSGSGSNSHDPLTAEQDDVPMPKRNGHDPNPNKAKILTLNQAQGSSTAAAAKKLDKPQFTTDPYDLFCLSIAGQLRKMPKEKAMLAQIEIMNIIYNTEFSQIDEGA